MISDPVATLLCCDNHAWLCIGEVNGLKVDGQYAEFVPHKILHEKTVAVSYQLLGLRPATLDDDLSSLSDWRSCRIEENSFTVPGQLIQPINPTVSTQQPHSTLYLLDSQFLVALAASLLEYLSASDLKNIPKLSTLPSPTHSKRIRPVRPDSDHSDQIPTILTKFRPNSEQEITILG